MTVKEFIEIYKADFSAIEQVEVKPYISVARKIEVIGNLLASIHFSNNKFQINTPFVHLMLPLVVIDEYTNIDINFENVIEDYDALCEQDLIGKLIEKIKPKEVQEFTVLLEKSQSDMLLNNASPQSYITENVEKFSAIVGTLLSPILEQLMGVVQEMDASKVSQIGEVLEKVNSTVVGAVNEKEMDKPTVKKGRPKKENK
nr:MAG TPA: hypothetical protein [Caudoviricetes sp.]